MRIDDLTFRAARFFEIGEDLQQPFHIVVCEKSAEMSRKFFAGFAQPGDFIKAVFNLRDILNFCCLGELV